MEKSLPAVRRSLQAAAAAALVGAWWAASGSAAAAGGLAIDGAWARASIGGSKVSAVYLSIINRGDAGDRLVGAAAERAGHAMLHRSVVEDGVARMRHVEALAIPPGTSVQLAPGGLHVMLTGVSPPLEVGEEVTVTLTFEEAGEVVATAPVRGGPPRE